MSIIYWRNFLFPIFLRPAIYTPIVSTHIFFRLREFDSFDQGTRADKAVRRAETLRGGIDSVQRRFLSPIEPSRDHLLTLNSPNRFSAAGNYPAQVGHLQAVVPLMIRFKYQTRGWTLFEACSIVAEREKLGHGNQRCSTSHWLNSMNEILRFYFRT